ncbi:MAG: hypothetical protein WAN36_01330, partial [Calditrichia bacterium]
MDSNRNILQDSFRRIILRILMLTLLPLFPLTCFANSTDTTRFSPRYSDSLLVHQNKLKSKTTVET